MRKEGFRVISLQRTIPSSSNYETRVFDLCKLDTINEELLYGIDILIHNAALVHKPQADTKLYKTMNFDEYLIPYNWDMSWIEEEVDEMVVLMKFERLSKE